MASLLSQELFDETIIENEECFDLSPEDALRETIDQFCQQLGVVNNDSTTSDGSGCGGLTSPTSVAIANSTNNTTIESSTNNAK